MKKRIFIAINLPDKVKERAYEIQQEVDSSFAYFTGASPIKWTKKNNLHVTLFFVGYLELDDLAQVFNIVQNVADDTDAFDLKLKNIDYAPPGKIPPKMVWINGEKSTELGNLQQKLEASLLEHPNINLERENSGFIPHITLGRIVQWQWARINPEEITELNKDFPHVFGVRTIEVMESELKKGGAEYTILKSFNLK
ncbi:MAG: RNA 2',3'-cyclic phosphodiesterase [Candidatus Pacebacteria bacterium]|nr:RNA 2',3'-cyclic phosphodiesterase [Candidatus Paceibacterota bacterium]